MRIPLSYVRIRTLPRRTRWTRAAESDGLPGSRLQCSKPPKTVPTTDGPEGPVTEGNSVTGLLGYTASPSIAKR